MDSMLNHGQLSAMAHDRCSWRKLVIACSAAEWWWWINCIGCQSVKESCIRLLYVYKSMKGLSPQYIQDCLTVKRRAECAMRTRSSGSTNFVVPVTKKCAGDRAFSVIAPRLWNILPVSIKNATSQQSFKSMLKDYLFPWLFSICFLISYVLIIFMFLRIVTPWKEAI